MIRTKETLN